MVCFKRAAIAWRIIEAFASREIIASLWWINFALLYWRSSQINSGARAGEAASAISQADRWRGILNIELSHRHTEAVPVENAFFQSTGDSCQVLGPPRESAITPFDLRRDFGNIVRPRSNKTGNDTPPVGKPAIGKKILEKGLPCRVLFAKRVTADLLSDSVSSG